ncbi:hypothetical protein PENSPDRAFT_687265 [Peniophora sp. CONT]|nr:hypothetical protein PENSPDRAFT_687265 [Peniophora sp. CONT]
MASLNAMEPSATTLIGQRPRFQLSNNLKKNAKGAVKAVISVLGTIATVTQDVPYIGVVSRVLAELLKVEDELEKLGLDWKSVMESTRQVKDVVDEVLRQCESTSSVEASLPQALVEPFDNLETCIVGTLEALHASRMTVEEDARWYHKVKASVTKVYHCSDLAREVGTCRADMQAALRLFRLKLDIYHAFKVRDMAATLLELRGSQCPPASASAQRIGSPMSLPPAPAIFHGRDSEIARIRDVISKHQKSARIAILGPGGIGKTSILLAVLYDPEVVQIFADCRYFLSCESITSAKGLVQQLMKLFDFVPDAKSRIARRDGLLSYLKTLPGGILSAVLRGWIAQFRITRY